jgi:hypothetical protein
VAGGRADRARGQMQTTLHRRRRAVCDARLAGC